LAGRTLRTRLIAGLLVLLAMSCLAIGVTTSITLRRFLVDRLDQSLASAGSRLDVSLEHGEPHSPQRPSGPSSQPGIEGQLVGTLAARIANGSIAQAVVINDTAGQVSLRNVALTPADRTALLHLAPDTAPTTIRLSALAEYRLRATRSPDNDIHITGLPLGDIDTTVHKLEATELIVFAAALLLTGLVGAGWVTLSLRPLRRVTTTAKQVSSLVLGSGDVNLPHRVPETDPRTEVGQLGVAFNQMLGHVETAFEQRVGSEARLRRFVRMRATSCGPRWPAYAAMRNSLGAASNPSPTR